jgi:hypothetical protein
MANLAGLAALAALGYGAHKYFNRSEDETSTVKKDAKDNSLRNSGPTITQEMKDAAIAEGNKVSEGERVAMSNRNIYDIDTERQAGESPKKSSSKPSPASSTRSLGSSSANPRDLEASMSRGRRPEAANPRDLEAKMSRGRRAPDVQSDSGYTGQGGSGRGGQGGPTAEELARYVQVPSSAQTQAGLETMVGGPSLKALNAMAKSVAGAAKPAKSAAMQAYERANMADRLNPNRAASSSATKRVLDEADTTGGAIGYRKGGAVKKMASGGMTSKPSSASKRGDGIAQKGKTNCKMR